MALRTAVSARSPEEAAMLARFAQQYSQGQAPAMIAIERSICGCDYGGTSWTTRSEAELLVQLLRLGEGRRLLDLGAGSGWPGLYLARQSRCDVALVDLPLEGLRIAAKRARRERLAGAVWAVQADGSGLPFEGASFDAISHSDVLCCLVAKDEVLRECRRAIRGGGVMVFSAISIAPALSEADHRRAAAAGPPFKAVSSEYPAMLEEAGWQLLQRTDLTESYGLSVRQRLSAEEAHVAALTEILGGPEYAETIARRRCTAEAIGDGLLRRELFTARASD